MALAIWIAVAFAIGLAIGLALLAWDHALMQQRVNDAQTRSAAERRTASVGYGPAKETPSAIERLFGAPGPGTGTRYASAGLARAIAAWSDPAGTVWGPAAPENRVSDVGQPGGGTGGGTGGSTEGGTGGGTGGGADPQTPSDPNGQDTPTDPGTPGGQDQPNVPNAPDNPATPPAPTPPQADIVGSAASVSPSSSGPRIGFTVTVDGSASWVELRVQRISTSSYSNSIRLERTSVSAGMETWGTSWKPPGPGTYRYTPVIYRGAVAIPGEAKTVVVD